MRPTASPALTPQAAVPDRTGQPTAPSVVSPSSATGIDALRVLARLLARQAAAEVIAAAELRADGSGSEPGLLPPDPVLGAVSSNNLP